jgi:hypothetical protein
VFPAKPGSSEWLASINGGHFGSYPDRIKAMRAVEREVEANVARLNADWQRFLAATASRRGTMPAPDKPSTDEAVQMEASVDEAIAIADGDPRAAVRALIVDPMRTSWLR